MGARGDKRKRGRTKERKRDEGGKGNLSDKPQRARNSINVVFPPILKERNWRSTY